MSDDTDFRGLVAVVQYRERGKQLFWRNMAAFDSLTMAEKYCQECAEGNSVFEYRALTPTPSAAGEK